MTDLDIQDFVTCFAAAWASRDGEAFLALWHPDGGLHSPLYDRPVLGRELGRLTDIVKECAPDSVWQLLDWTTRGDVVVEWQNTRIVGSRRFDWRGVEGRDARADHFPLRVPLIDQARAMPAPQNL